MRAVGLSMFLSMLASGEAFAGVVINEVLPNPADGDSGKEWIELYNNGSSSVDLSGYKIEAGSSTYSLRYTFPSGSSVAAGDWLVVGDASVSGADLALAAGATLALGNGSDADAVRLLNSSGAVVDTLIYSSPNTENAWKDDSGAVATSLAPKAGEGQSVARRKDGVDTDQSAVDFLKLTVPTPGATNGNNPSGTCEVGALVVINEFMPDPEGTDTGNEWVEIYNKGTSSANLESWRLKFGTSSFSSTVTLPVGATVSAGGFLVVGAGSGVSGVDVVDAALSLGNAGSNGDAVRLEDCTGVVADTVVYGANNSDNFVDDTGAAATSVAPKPASGKSLARVSDGQDTNASGTDFVLVSAPTPGNSNSAPGTDCGARTTKVKINEFLPDPEGTDDGKEWVELYNAGSSTVDLSNWALQSMTTREFSRVALFASGTSISAGDWLLVGGSAVSSADVTFASFALPNGTNGDSLRLVDCSGVPADTVAFGKDNDDQVIDDSGSAATSLAPDPPQGSSLQRISDGADTDRSGDDFALQTAPTPGAANPEVEYDPCVPVSETVVINEIFPNPGGDDAGLEWIELYNPSSSPVSLSGWYLALASGSPSDQASQDVVFSAGNTIPSKGFFVLGGASVPEADLVRSFSLSNGDNGDAVRLHDCAGTPVDTVIYGDSNDDGMLDDTNQAPAQAYGRPMDDQSLARMGDGLDANVDIDWFIDVTPSPAAANVGGGGAADTDGDGLPDPPDGTGCGCASAHAPTSWLGWGLVLAAGLRRRSVSRGGRRSLR
jgi:hypothetical protein